MFLAACPHGFPYSCILKRFTDCNKLIKYFSMQILPCKKDMSFRDFVQPGLKKVLLF